MKSKVVVCTHKEYPLLSNGLYYPLQVGKTNAQTDLGIQGDNTGDNISAKNYSYCELTGLYWAWKNLKNVDYIGLAHYKRYLLFSQIDLTAGKNKTVLQRNVIDPAEDLRGYDILLPVPYRMSHSVANAYIFAHVIEDFFIMNRVILKKYPKCEDAMVRYFYKSNKWIAYNMFFTSWGLFDEYCHWLFSILFEVEKHVRLSGYSFQRRIFGFMGELLLPLFCFYKKLRIGYRPILTIDAEGTARTQGKRIGFSELKNNVRFLVNRPYSNRHISCRGENCHVDDYFRLDNIDI